MARSELKNPDITDDELYADQSRLPPRDELLDYLYLHTGKIIPYKPVCPDHNAPAEFIDHIVYGYGSVCAIGPRSGSKTTQIGIGVGMVARHFGVSTRVLGGSAYQSLAAYREFKDFLGHGFILDVYGKMLQSRTEFINGGTVELLTQSETSVRSPHVPFVALDELDEFKPKILKASKFIAQSVPNFRRKMVEASTRHRPMGLMTLEWDLFKGLKLIWCLLEVMEPCTGDYKCSMCNLTASCPGKAKMGPKYKERSGYYLIDDARQLRDDVHDDETWISEAMCGEPRTEGAIYTKLKERIHMGTLPWDRGLALDRVFDYGAADSPCVLQYWQLTKENGRLQARMVDELRWQGTADRLIVDDFLSYEKEMGYNNWIGRTIIPGDGASLRNECETRGLSVELPDQDVAEGIATMRNLIAVDKKGTPGVKWDKEAATTRTCCHPTWTELKGYHMIKGRVVKEDDHGPDASRYYCQSTPELVVHKKSSMIILPDNLDINP